MSNDDLEIRQLKETIVALREELERVRFEEREHIQQAVAGVNEEVRQLHASIVELRDQLELREGEHQEKLRDIVLHHDREKAELHQTISRLRASLEELNESIKKADNPAKTPAPATPR